MKLQNYEYEIDIQSNQKFNHFSFLNLVKRLYLAFDNTEPSYEPIANINLPKTDILVNHIRNQHLKRYCIIVIRLAQQNITATQFYNSSKKKFIRFTNDNQNS